MILTTPPAAASAAAALPRPAAARLQSRARAAGSAAATKPSHTRRLLIVGGIMAASAVVAAVITVRPPANPALVGFGGAAVLTMSFFGVRPIRGQGNVMWISTAFVHLGLCLVAGPAGGLVAALADGVGGWRRRRGWLIGAATTSAYFLANLAVFETASLIGFGELREALLKLSVACVASGLVGFVVNRLLVGLLASASGRAPYAGFLLRSVSLLPYVAGFSWAAVGFLLMSHRAGAFGFLVMLMPVLLLHGFLLRLSRSVVQHEVREAAFTTEREELLRQTIDVSERERQRLAGDLHDGVIQLICAVTIRSATLSRGLRREGVADNPRLAHAAEGLERITVDLQAATADLRSLMGALANVVTEPTGLGGALTDLLTPLADEGIEVEVSIGEVHCDEAQRSLIFRVAQELVRNIAKHACASSVVLRLGGDADGIRLTVIDNGSGFRADELQRRRRDGSLGLGLLEQRVSHMGGQLTIDSVPGRGTVAEAWIPLR